MLAILLCRVKNTSRLRTSHFARRTSHFAFRPPLLPACYSGKLMLDARQNGIPDSSSFHSLLVCLAAICYGSITVGARYFDQIVFSWFEISFLIVFVPLPLVPFVLLRSDFRVSPGQLGFFLVFGVIGAGLQLAQYLGIVLAMPVAVVALLLYSQPIWTVVLGRLILGEPVTSRKLAALGLAVLGTILLLEPWNARADYNLWGVLGGVAGGLLLSLWVICGRLSSLRRQHLHQLSLRLHGLFRPFLVAGSALAQWHWAAT